MRNTSNVVDLKLKRLLNNEINFTLTPHCDTCKEGDIQTVSHNILSAHLGHIFKHKHVSAADAKENFKTHLIFILRIFLP